MNAKTIADLIHDRAFAEGATLCVWLDGCRFRRINEPSPELAALMRRNIEELRSYLRGVVSEWCKEFGVDAAGGVKA